ncbi:MAG: transposase [Kiritimatiellales bacterium]
MVTCGTYQKCHHLNTASRLTFVQETLFETAEEFGWHLQAWAILSNHYHFIAASPANPEPLSKMLSKLHTVTAIRINKEDNCPGRKIWYQYFDSHITYQNSYFARLRYVHYNPVHHTVAHNAENYPWCSAAWFSRSAGSAFYKTIQGFKTDAVNVTDPYEVIPVNRESESGVEPPHSKQESSL